MTTTTKEEGIARALDSYQQWQTRFRRAVRVVSHEMNEFTSEDIVRLVGLPTGEARMNANNAVGAMMNALGRTGMIEKTGARRASTRRSSHGAELTVWRRGRLYV